MNQRYDRRTLDLLRSERDQMSERFKLVNAHDIGARACAEISLKALDDKVHAYEQLLSGEEPYEPIEYREIGNGRVRKVVKA